MENFLPLLAVVIVFALSQIAKTKTQNPNLNLGYLLLVWASVAYLLCDFLENPVNQTAIFLVLLLVLVSKKAPLKKLL